MTGRSDFSRPCLRYYRWLVSGVLIVSGSFLIMEHLTRFGGFDAEVIGHEWYGLGLIVLGILLSLKWRQLPALIEAIKRRDWKAALDEGERSMGKEDELENLERILSEKVEHDEGWEQLEIEKVNLIYKSGK